MTNSPNTNTGSLHELIDPKLIECMNQDDNFPVSNVLNTRSPKVYLQSFTDPELLLKVAFQQAVRMEQLVLTCARTPDDALDLETAPASLKVFTNNIDMGFSEAESQIPLAEWTFKESDFIQANGRLSIPLNVAKFRYVRGICLFFGANLGDKEVTRIGHIAFMGKPVDAMNMKDWKPVDKSQQYGIDD